MVTNDSELDREEREFQRYLRDCERADLTVTVLFSAGGLICLGIIWAFFL